MVFQIFGNPMQHSVKTGRGGWYRSDTMLKERKIDARDVEIVS